MTLRNYIESRNKESRAVKDLDSSASPFRKVVFVYCAAYRLAGALGSMLYIQLTHLACLVVDSGCPSRADSIRVHDHSLIAHPESTSLAVTRRH